MFLRRILNIFHRVVKKSVFSPLLHTRENANTFTENADTFTTWEDIYKFVFFCFVFFSKEKFLFILYSKESYVPFFPGCFSSDCTFSVCLLGIILGVNLVCLRTAFLRNQPSEKVWHMTFFTSCKRALCQSTVWYHMVWNWCYTS